MKEQNYSNHTQYVPGFHFFTYGVCLAVLIIAGIHLANVFGEEGWVVRGLLPFLAGIGLLMLCWYSRAFALKAQDRAIRAEEKLRYYLLTGKPMPSALRTRQIIALRFASDEEFPALAEKALQENLSSKQIKQAISNWKADHNRV